MKPTYSFREVLDLIWLSESILDLERIWGVIEEEDTGIINMTST
jgi:hypothetical protein